MITHHIHSTHISRAKTLDETKSGSPTKDADSVSIPELKGFWFEMFFGLIVIGHGNELLKCTVHRHPAAPVWGPCPKVFIIWEDENRKPLTLSD